MEKTEIVKSLTNSFKILRKTVAHFGENRPVDLAATTAYFAIFSIAPIIIIIIAVFGYFAGDQLISDKLFNELDVLMGQESSRLLKEAIENYNISEKSGIATVVGIGIFLFSATTLFSILQKSINYIWRVDVKSNIKMNLLNLLKTRVFSFGVILSLGFVLLVSLLLDAGIAFLKDFLASQISSQFVVLAQVANFVLSFGIIAVVFAIIFKFLPDVDVKWSASWFASIFTSLLFTLGKFLIGIIIGNSKLGAVYGAASSFVVILLWIFYVSMIFYFGVEITHQFSKFHNHINKPKKYAVPFEIHTLSADKKNDG